MKYRQAGGKYLSYLAALAAETRLNVTY